MTRSFESSLCLTISVNFCDANCLCNSVFVPYVCICITCYAHTFCVFAYVCVYVCVCTSVADNVAVCVYICMCVCVCVYVCVYVCTSVLYFQMPLRFYFSTRHIEIILFSSSEYFRYSLSHLSIVFIFRIYIKQKGRLCHRCLRIIRL